MEFVHLTDEQRETFETNGYFIVRSVLDSEQVARLTAAADRIMDSFDYNGYYAHKRDGLVQAPVFAELTSQTAAIPLVIQLLGPNIHITNTALIYKHPQPPEKPMSRGWHRDAGLYMDLGHKDCPRVGLKVGYCLTDFTVPNSGGTLFVPKSHLSGEPLGIPEGDIDPIVPYDDPVLRAGDAFLFENRIYHTAGVNFTEHVAKVIIYGYHYRWLKPEPYLLYYNDRLQPDAQVTEHLDDLGKQFLGDGSGAAAAWAAAHNLTFAEVAHTVTIPSPTASA